MTTEANVETVRKDISTMRDELPKLEQAVTKAKGMADIRKAVDAYESKEKAISKAERSIKDSEFAANKTQRDAAIKVVVDAVTGAPAAFNKAFDLGISKFEITRNEDGSIAVQDRIPGRGGSGGGGRGRNSWTVNGSEYTSRELLETFGAQEFDEEWLEKVWQRQAEGAGFDAPVKALAKKLNATLTQTAPANGDSS